MIQLRKGVFVSIHAPTRGATATNANNSNFLGFNPRTHEGCDLQVHHSEYQTQFQSTHPRGVRQDGLLRTQTIYCFNPRTHEGCDEKVKPFAFNIFVSIHAPTRGAT